MIRAHTSYIVCATPRSGSSLLSEALKNTSLAGRAKEYFDQKSESIWRTKWGISSSSDYFRWISDRGTSANGVFGAKIMWEQMAYCVRLLRQLPQYQRYNYNNVPELISTVFPNVSYIWIMRRDKVRQAVSNDIAIQTRNYAWVGDEKPASDRRAIFNFNRLDYLHDRIIAADNAWQQYFTEAGVTPFKVVYEEFVEGFEQTIRAILEHLSIHMPPNHTFDRPKLKRMADALNDEWARRYNEIKTQQPKDDARIRRRLAQWGALKARGF
ncbi:MAG: Stf0 family sulfotransferase [Gammaproteobacteria bacterium]